MGRQIQYAPAAAKALRRMDAATRKRIMAKVRQLADDPGSLANNVKMLRGSDGWFRLRVGDWRVIYSETGAVLHVLRVAPRGSAY